MLAGKSGNAPKTSRNIKKSEKTLDIWYHSSTQVPCEYLSAANMQRIPNCNKGSPCRMVCNQAKLFLRTMDAVGVESRFKATPMPKSAPNPKATAAKQAAKAKPTPPPEKTGPRGLTKHSLAMEKYQVQSICFK